MIRSEYLRFLQTLKNDDVSSDVRKIANLVLDNLDILTPLSTAQGQRVKKIVEFSQKSWNTTSSDIQAAPVQSIKQNNSITKLKSLAVGPFRGFAKQENFDLSSQVVLIYGPNGTGKSSFCEALEFGLLGNIAEAESKRFREQREYFKNAHTNSYTLPVLMGIDNDGNEVKISANESSFRFCFVEKNRIESFSRIAAQLPARQAELISTLFGLDAFSEFVRNFTTPMDGKHIDLEGAKEKELNQKRQTIAGFQQQLKSFPEQLRKQDEDEKVCANEYRQECSFSQMFSEINGIEGKGGLIAQLEEEVQKPIDSKNNLILADLESLQQSIQTNIEELKTKQQELNNASQQLSFKQLYEAVKGLKTNNVDECPACRTPLSQVMVDPFTHAETELEKLQHLSELEGEAVKLKEKITIFLNHIVQIINTCCFRFPEKNQLLKFQIKNGDAITIDWWHTLHQKLDDNFTPWKHIKDQVNQLEKNDNEIEEFIKKLSEKQTQLKKLRTFQEKITVLKTCRRNIEGNRQRASNAIDGFDTENSQLIVAAELEKLIVAQNKIISNAYNIFVQKLNVYKDELPTKLVEDLGETVVTLYNAFNRNDAENEQLSTVRLPLYQNERLEISYKNSPEKFFDALHILSEGHVRCLGLAILTAKNIKENCKILIFDDPVNAIDDDHRGSIRRTLFEDHYFKGKQIILTCHGEEFFKDIQNQLPAKKESQPNMFSFLPKIDGFHIHVDYNCPPRNYILASRSHYNKSQIRDALIKARQALECLTKTKIWPYVEKYGDSNLSIKLRSAKGSIELRNLTEQLKSKISEKCFSHDKKDNILKPLEVLLGIDGGSAEWRYLNKGAHEDANRAEFDRQTVSQIITNLELLDEACQ